MWGTWICLVLSDDMLCLCKHWITLVTALQPVPCMSVERLIKSIAALMAITVNGNHK